MKAQRRFVNKFKIERKLMATYLGLFMGSFLIYLTLHLLLTYLLLSRLDGALGPGNEELRQDLEAIIRGLVVTQLVIGVLYTFATSLIFVTFVHRIFGAVFAIKNYLRRVLETGKADPPLVLRKGDQLQEIAGYINQLLAKR